MKQFQVTITCWDDGIWRGHKSFQSEDDKIEVKFVNNLAKLIEEVDEKIQRQQEVEDDIPF